MHPLETYLKDLHEIRSTAAGVPEESYYGALENLLNGIGKSLKPEVRCVGRVADTGAGHPDFGLYTSDQFQKSKDKEPIPGLRPERGVIEVKPTKDDAWLTTDGTQVTKYWGHYNRVLVTNYRDFLLIGRDQDDNPGKLESYRLAETERASTAPWHSTIRTTHARTQRNRGKSSLRSFRPAAGPGIPS